MKALRNILKRPSLLILALPIAMVSAQAELGSGTIVMHERGELIKVYEDRVVRKTIQFAKREPEPITLSDPELEARIRAVGFQALRERAEDLQRESTEPSIIPMWEQSSPEYRLARRVQTQLIKERRAELKAGKENLPPLEKMAVYHVSSVVDDEDLMPHRFSDTSRLFSMLRDPLWARYWGSIAVTIARVADEESTLKLAEFIKDTELPQGREYDANQARLRAIRALPAVPKAQEIAELTAFLEKLTDSDFADSLGFSQERMFGREVRNSSINALGAIGNAKAVDILQRLYQEAQAQKDALDFQPPSSDRRVRDAVAREISLLERQLNRARAKQLGVPDTLDGTRDPRYSR